MADLPVIDMEVVHRTLGEDEDDEFLMELLTDLLQDEKSCLDNLKAAVAANDHKAFVAAAHLIKGAALNLGLRALGSVVQATEYIGRALERAAANELDRVEWEGQGKELSVDELLSLRPEWVAKVETEYARVREFYEKKKAA